MFKVAISALLLTVFWSCDAFAASCMGFGAGANGNRNTEICKRCTLQVQRATSHDTACEFNMIINGNFTMVGAKLETPPQHGKVIVSGTQWRYTPAKGFAGTDTFTVERDFVDNTSAFVVFYAVTMTVSP